MTAGGAAIRIAVDARQLFRANRRGIGKTLAEVYAALARRRPGWEFVLVHQLAVPGPPALAGLANVRAVRVDIPGGDRFGLWEAVRLPAAAVGCRAAALHCPANTGPRFPLAPMVLTVHDLIPLEIAPDVPDTRAWVKAVSAACRAARHITTVSEYSKSQLVARLGVPADKITVIGHAPDSRLARVTDPAELDRVRAKYGLRPGEPYAFGFGAADPRKNTARLIEAYAALPAELRAEFRLLLVGIQNEAAERFRRVAEERAVADRVVLHGFADEADLPALMSGATVLCFPSRSEGFGLPILDAFACRLPVLAGDRTSLPEVAGDAAVLVAPDDTAAVRDGLARLLAEPALRDRLRDRGTERLKGFTWDAAAEAYAGVFERVAR